MGTYSPLKEKELPAPPHWSKAIGVGVVVMGLSMGTGELILWPHLVAKFGLGLLSFALLGITFQYFINQEVARHALATGEGFFTSSARISAWFAPFWLLGGTLLYIWPGWAGAIGTTLTELFGFGNYIWWARAALGFALILTLSGRIAYAMLERSLKIIVPAFFVLLVAISFFNLTAAHIGETLRGLVSFSGIPAGVDINVLLSAIVFAGAGGMLNLCVSLWYCDKQLGMAKYGGKIVNPITGKQEMIPSTGYSFNAEKPQNIRRWKGWMRYVRIDQGAIFWFLGLVSIVLLAANAYAVLTPRELVPEGLNLAVTQAHIFGDEWGPWGFKLFLVMAFLMLFAVMWTVIDALSRIVSNILYTNSRTGPFKNRLAALGKVPLNVMYYGIIILVIAAGALLLPLEQPLTLLTISAVLGGLTMAIYTPLLIYINNVKLPKPLRPHWTTTVIMSGISLFFIYFTLRIAASYIG